jgi:hypothetical protein
MGITQKPTSRHHAHIVIAAIAALGLAACGDLASALPPRPTPFPILERLPSVTPVTPRPLPPATAMPLAVAAPTPTLALPSVIVPANANMRRGPGVNFAIVAVISAGSSIVLSQRQGDWYAVHTADGQSGWISSLVLEVDPTVAASVPLAQP